MIARVGLFSLGFLAGVGLGTFGVYYAIRRVADEVLA